MFGDLKGMMGKLKEAQAKVTATKQRMDTVLIDKKSNDGLINVTITANCRIIAQNLHFFLLFSGAFLPVAPAQSYFQ